jgi:hypothetical protein
MKRTAPVGDFQILAIRLVSVLAWLSILWVGVVMSNDMEPFKIWPWSELLFHDLIATVCVALVYLAVAWEQRSWAYALITFVPIIGLVFSLLAFWRLYDRWIVPQGQDTVRTS